MPSPFLEIPYVQQMIFEELPLLIESSRHPPFSKINVSISQDSTKAAAIVTTTIIWIPTTDDEIPRFSPIFNEVSATATAFKLDRAELKRFPHCYFKVIINRKYIVHASFQLNTQILMPIMQMMCCIWLNSDIILVAIIKFFIVIVKVMNLRLTSLI